MRVQYFYPSAQCTANIQLEKGEGRIQYAVRSRWLKLAWLRTSELEEGPVVQVAILL